MKLDLAGGNTPQEGFESVDLYAPQARHRVDLFRFPYPWDDASVAALHCSHFIEHIPAREVEERDFVRMTPRGDTGMLHANRRFRDTILGKDMLYAFFDECWRILQPRGKLRVVVPYGRSRRAFQDPTHRRFFVEETFAYLSRALRKQMGVAHYGGGVAGGPLCNFAIKLDVIVDDDIEAQIRAVGESPVARRRLLAGWDVISDLAATLTKLAPDDEMFSDVEE
ncbi:MAG: hypothetical protein Q8S13_09220 [Dehalococcoidia bacterium]|nr:hypothetical protein [Dehalococcoidia bacterium]